MQPDPGPSPEPRNPELRGALLHVAVTAGLTIVLLIVGMSFSGTPETVLLAIAPVLPFIGALIAVRKTFRLWKSRGRWQVWQGAMWFLMMMTVVMLMGVIPYVTDTLP